MVTPCQGTGLSYDIYHNQCALQVKSLSLLVLLPLYALTMSQKLARASAQRVHGNPLTGLPKRVRRESASPQGRRAEKKPGPHA